MRMFQGMRISATGMDAEKKRLELISQNIANANTASASGEKTYQAQRLITTPKAPAFGTYLQGFREIPDGGVNMAGVAEVNNPPRLEYDPGHPLADEDGYVTYPDVNLLDEMVDAITASKSYESNMTAFNESKKMFSKALEIGK